MDTVVYDRIEDVLGRIESLYGRVEDTYLVAKDILLGTQISDWIADLKASGTASATYSDASRMNVLIANEDAVNNTEITKYLCSWAIANNKVGLYFGTFVSEVSDVNWEECTTVQQLYANTTAFNAVANNANSFNALLNNSTMKNSLYTYWQNVENSLANSSVATNKLSSLSSGNGNMGGGNRDTNAINFYKGKKMWFSHIQLSVGPSWGNTTLTVTITKPDGSTWSNSIQTGDYYTNASASIKMPLNKFGTRLQTTVGSGTGTGWQEPKVVFFS